MADSFLRMIHSKGLKANMFENKGFTFAPLLDDSKERA